MNIREVERLFLDIEHQRITSGRPTIFTVIPAHIALLRELRIFWQDNPKGDNVTWLTGAPSINLRRPYGNSGIEADVANIIGVPEPDWDAGEDWTEEELSAFAVLHRSMEIVLQIAVQCNGIEPGDYISQWPGHWVRLSTIQGELNNAVLLH